MFLQIFKMEDLIFYILAAELVALLLTQFRTNYLLKKTLKVRAQKKEVSRQLKEEVKNGQSDIPVVKFASPKQGASGEKKAEKKGVMDAKELAVLQEMMTEFFG
jgi:hypothetical protein